MLRTVTVVPTILVNNKQDFRDTIEKYNSFTRRVQIDITDGEFTTAKTLDVTNIWWPKTWEVDLHMMVKRPSEHIETILKLHPSLVIFHVEIEENLLPIFEQLRKEGIKVGVALLKSTYPGKVKDYILSADHVLIFAGGELGKQGGRADMMQMEKVPIIRNMKPEVEIGWDGGANINNLRALSHADIDIINVGSALSKAAEPAEVYKALTEEIDKNGVVI